MTLAPQELENTASKYAAEAIKLDSQGSHSSAINSYQRASEALIKLVQIYPEYKLNRVYLERASAYQNRIKSIQMANGILEEGRHNSSDIQDFGDSIKNKDSFSNSNDLTNKSGNSSKHGPSQNVNSQYPPKNANASSTNTIQELGKELASLILKEKPLVTWNEVIGLDDAKRAIRESIVYPTKRADLFPLGWPRGIKSARLVG